MRRVRLIVGILVFSGIASMQFGCVFGAIIGGGIENIRRESNKTVELDYTGLQGKTFAVVVNSDRVIEGEFPGIGGEFTRRINDRLWQNKAGSGGMKSDPLVGWLSNNPDWVVKPPSELAKTLNVDRLIWIDLDEFRLNEPGNQYLWSGLASGTVRVYESESVLPDQPAMERAIAVKFPDKTGAGPEEFDRLGVSSTLIKRFVDRASWLFYTHQEKYYPDY